MSDKMCEPTPKCLHTTRMLHSLQTDSLRTTTTATSTPRHHNSNTSLLTVGLLTKQKNAQQSRTEKLVVKGKWPALAFLAVDTVAKLNLLAGTLESKISEKFYKAWKMVDT